jgi:exodeoxyribonuclease V gamma subunit
MPGFNIYHSNRSEVLVAELASIVSSPWLPPLQKEIIVVQSKGMERWLVQQLGTQFGIWANGAFPFPNAMLREVLTAILGEIPPENLFMPELLAWRIQRLLPGLLERAGFENLKLYAAEDKHGLKVVQLCYRLAEMLDRYTIYRPEMILRWDGGEESHWQAQLWRDVVAETGNRHRVMVRQQFFEKLRRTAAKPARLPARISIFGISALPAFHLEVFTAIARLIDVHLFLMSPSQEFWADILSAKEQAKRRQKERRQMQFVFPANPYFETGHPLLASLGKRARDFSAMLLDCAEAQEWSHYEDPGEQTLLTCLQSDILKLRHRGQDGFRKVVDDADRSLQVHSCHSPMREMEVLYDQLLALFDEDPGLQPNDILVMTPDIGAYAPYISAVFAGAHEREGRIPFSVSDRTDLGSNLVVRAFLKVLELGESRLPAPAVMDLLDIPLVQQRFKIRPQELGLLRRWVEETRICWGIDGDDRASRHGVPAFEENSWKAGLERMLLGYALSSEENDQFCGVVPFNDVEGSGALLGRFLEFAYALFALTHDLRRLRSLSEWSESLLDWMNRFLVPVEALEEDFHFLRVGLKHLAELQRHSGFDTTVRFEIARYALQTTLKQHEPGVGFLASGVTFCAMLPMRSIPFKVIALVGMDNRTFPRSQRPVAFDLVASNPKPGDPSSREEDRFIFLEALLSARKKLYISYVGQSIRDNSETPPSVVVSELMEAVEQGFVLGPQRESIIDHIWVRHKLQAFSPAYFMGVPGFFSYSEENLDALKAWHAAARAGEDQVGRYSSTTSGAELSTSTLPRLGVPKPFVAGSIGEAPEEFRQVDLLELRRFFRNPTAYFCRKRLRLRLDEDKQLSDGREPFVLNVLDGYSVEQELLDRKLAGHDLSSAYAAYRSRGLLPAGAAGELVFQDAVASVERFTNTLLPLLQGEPLAPADFDLEVDSLRLTGRVDQVWHRHHMNFRCATVKAKDRLSIWIDHLLLQHHESPGYPKESVLAAKDGVWRLRPVLEAREILRQLLNYYWEGLQEPLPFFPQSAYRFADKLRQGKKDEEALIAAQRVWDSDQQSRGECEDPYYQLNWAKVDALGGRFSALALAIFGPLLKHQEELKL